MQYRNLHRLSDRSYSFSLQNKSTKGLGQNVLYMLIRTSYLIKNSPPLS